MRITVKLFAQMREEVERPEITVEVPAGISCREIVSRLQREFPSLAALVGSAFVALNGAYADREAVVSPGDEIAILPPVSGG